MISNNMRGAFLGLAWLVLRFLKMELLISHDKTKTLELGIQDWEENNKIGFDLKDRVEITYMGQNINRWVLNRLGHKPRWGVYVHTSNSSKPNSHTKSTHHSRSIICS
jgi:hypothetical protein